MSKKLRIPISPNVWPRSPRREFHAGGLHCQATVVEPDIRSRARGRIEEIDRLQPRTPFLFDTFNRRHDYLRISLTERCNLRCFYCMPSEGVELTPNTNILSDDEIIRLASLFVRSGVSKIRLTGGEPTVRNGIVELVGRLNALRPQGLKSIAMTSNGIALHNKLPKLIDNGLTHLNLSLDTLDPFKFEVMTRRQGHHAVLRSLKVALESSALQTVKLNVVVIRDLNDSEVLKFVEFTKDNDLSVRFIEFMPFTGNKWDKKKMVPSSDLLSRIESQYPGVYKVADEINDTARSYRIPGHKGSFGFISSMSDHFCGTCNRLRLTADGQIKVCLFDSKEVSLRDLVRMGVSDEILLETIRAALGNKKEKHAGMEDIDTVHNRPMILIGDHHLSSFDPLQSCNIPLRGTRFVRNAPLRIASQRSISSTSTRPRRENEPHLSHIDDLGRPTMVNVSDKLITRRTATARGRIYIPKIAHDLICQMDTIGDDGTGSLPTGSDIARRAKKVKSKGDVLGVAQLAGIMASKRTSDLIPLCHPISLSNISVDLTIEKHQVPSREVYDDTTEEENAKPQYSILCQANVACEGKTGVEMEALTAVSVSLLTVWDMLKAVGGQEMKITDVFVTSKSGGKSSDFIRSLPNA